MHNTTKRALPFLVLAALLAGCGKSSPTGKNRGDQTQAVSAASPAQEHVPIHGRVMNVAPVPLAHIELRPASRHVTSPNIVAHATADLEGRFSIEALGDGPYEIVAHLPAEPGATYVSFVAIDSQSPIVVSPLSTIAAGLVRRQMRTRAAGDAVTYSVQALASHFQIVGLGQVEPTAWPPRDIASVMREGLVPALQAQLVLQGLQRTALGLCDLRQEPPSVPSLAALSHLLAEDLEADGIIDGRGAGAKRLQLGGQSYDGALLRAKLAQHLLDIADEFGLSTRWEYCKTAQAIADNPQAVVQKPLFPGRLFCQPQQLTVSGRIASIDPNQPWQVDAWAVGRDGNATDLRASSEVTMGDRTFSFDVYSNAGPLLIRAYPVGHGERYFSTIIVPPTEDRATAWVNIHPLSTLSAAYARGLVRKENISLQHALKLSSYRLSQHFGTDSDLTEVSSSFDIDAWFAADAPLNNNKRTHLLCRALGEIGESEPLFSNEPAARWQKIFNLTWLLSEDVVADAEFNGLGDEQRQLSLDGYCLSNQTLRADLTQSLLRLTYAAYASAHPEPTSTPRSTSLQETQVWSRSLLNTMQSPFAAPVAAIASRGPSFIDSCFIIDGQHKRPLSRKLRGVMQLECHVEEGHFLANANVVISALGRHIDAGSEVTVVAADGHHGKMLRFFIDTRKISAIGGETLKANIHINATNTIGVFEQTNLEVFVDNTKPLVACVACKPHSASAEQGEVWSAAGDPVVTDLHITGKQPFRIEPQCDTLDVTWANDPNDDKKIDEDIGTSTFRLVGQRLKSVHHANNDIVLRVTDGAGNDSNYILHARWSDDGPMFANPPVTLEAHDQFQNPDLRFDPTPSDTSVNFISRRYANHLDYDPEHDLPPLGYPLPKLHVHLLPDDPNSLPATLLEYRATPYTDTSFETSRLSTPSAWRTAHADSLDGHAVLLVPLSFQTLLPDDLLENTMTLPQSIRMLFHNPKFNGPAAWQIDIRATDQFGNQSYRKAKILFDVRVPPVSPLQARSSNWCNTKADEAAFRPHRGIVHGQVHWPMFESEHSLFRRPPLKIRITYPQPPVTTITKTEWYIETTDKPAFWLYSRGQWELRKKWECERRLSSGNTQSGIWIERGDLCLPAHKFSAYDEKIFVGTDLIPFSEGTADWLAMPPEVVEEFYMFEPTKWVESQSEHRTEIRKSTSLYESRHSNGDIKNTRAKISESKVLAWHQEEARERRLHEFVMEASTHGQARWSFDVGDVFLKLDMADPSYTQDISCALQPSTPWVY